MSRESAELLLTHGAALVLECTPDGVRYLERTGQLSAVRVNGVRLFKRADVEELQRKRKERRKATSPEAA